MSAATDNVGLFFGEDIFLAIGSIVLIQQIAGELTGSKLDATAAGGVGDPQRDCRLRHPRHAAAAARPAAGADAASDHPALALHRSPARCSRRFALLARATIPTPSGWAMPPSGGCWRQPAGGDLLGDFGNGLLVLGLVATCRVRPDRAQPPRQRPRRSSAPVFRRARQQAVPAGADHPLHRIRRDIGLSTTRRSKPWLDRARSADTSSSSGCGVLLALDRVLRLAAAACRSHRCRKAAA